MSDLKNQVFRLFEKRPIEAQIAETGGSLRYCVTDSLYYSINVIASDNSKFAIGVEIWTDYAHYERYVEISEKEFMNLKWKIEDWQSILEQEAFDKFEEFANIEPGTMDDLLND